MKNCIWLALIATLLLVFVSGCPAPEEDTPTDNAVTPPTHETTETPAENPCAENPCGENPCGEEMEDDADDLSGAMAEAVTWLKETDFSEIVNGTWDTLEIEVTNFFEILGIDQSTWDKMTPAERTDLLKAEQSKYDDDNPCGDDEDEAGDDDAGGDDAEPENPCGENPCNPCEG